MDNYLLRYAIDNVWCNPAVDNQFTYALQQLTPRYGVRSDYVVEQTRYFMPTNNNRDYYHVYQIGQVIPANIGLGKMPRDTWVPLKDIATKYLTLANAHQTNGVRYSLSETYVMITGRSNLLVAIKVNDLFPALDDNQIYLHLYHNAFFETKRSGTLNLRWIHTDCIVAPTQESIRSLQLRIMTTLADKGGIGMYFVNGRPVNEISIVTAAPGDHCDFILDASIKKEVILPIDSLKVFNSTLDTQRKYIIHYNDPDVKLIEFYDDLTVFLVKPTTAVGSWKGVTYHHNDGIWLRQLTHKDYSMPVAKVQELVSENPEWSDLSNLVVRMYTRHSGYDRPLVADVSRIWELYRLTSTQILDCMTGVDAHNPIWRAESLEQSNYVQFMSADESFIYPITFNEPELNDQAKIDAQDFAGEVFGYYGVGKLMANNPAKIVPDPNSGVKRADLAYYYWRDATVFEYDVQGNLLGYHYHAGGRHYYPFDINCEMVECITGKGSDNLHGVYGNGTVPLKFGYNFRIYVTKVWGGIPTNEWRDITDAPDRDSFGFYDNNAYNPKWTWTIDPKKYLGYVRTDENFYLKEIRFTDAPGVVRLQVSAWEDLGSGLVNKPMEIPFGQLVLIYNNRALVAGLDYYTEGELIVISNLEYRTTAGEQNLLVIGSGFCSVDLERYPPSEVGFVEYGVLSNDGEYQIHAHKMQRIIVDGRYRAYSDVVFEEQQSAFVINDVRNGAPYQIQTPQVTLKSVFRDDIKALEEDAKRDQWTSEAMGYYFPKRVRDKPDDIKDHYHVYSCYSQKILTEILAGRLKPPFVNGHYSDQDVVKQLKRYDWLKPFDILNREFNTNHVIVYPHWFEEPIGLTTEEYDYYRRILKLQLRQSMDLSPFIFIKR